MCALCTHRTHIIYSHGHINSKLGLQIKNGYLFRKFINYGFKEAYY